MKSQDAIYWLEESSRREEKIREGASMKDKKYGSSSPTLASISALGFTLCTNKSQQDSTGDKIGDSEQMLGKPQGTCC